MSKSVRDYTHLTAPAQSTEGIVRQNSRLRCAGIVRLVFVCMLLFALPAVTYAQPPDLNSGNWADGIGGAVYYWDGADWVYGMNPYQSWTPLYDGQYGGDGQIPGPPGPPAVPNGAPVAYLYANADNVSGGNRYTAGGLLLQGGSVRGVFNVTPNSRGWDHWWVGGSLTNDGGDIYLLGQLTVQGTVSNLAGGQIYGIDRVNFLSDAYNNAGANIGLATTNGFIYELNVSGALYNSGPSADNGRAQILHVETINAGYLYNYGLIQTQLTNTGFGVGYINVANDLINGNNRYINPDNSIRQRREAEIIMGQFIFGDTGQAVGGLEITVGGDLIQYFDGSIRAVASYKIVYDGNGYGYYVGAPNIIEVGGELYNAGEIRIDSSNGAISAGRWEISAGSIYNDGRSWSQRNSTGGGYDRAGQDDAWGIIYDAQIKTSGNLTNIGLNATINGMVTADLELYAYQNLLLSGDVSRDMLNCMHVGGNLYNLDRATIMNYNEIVVDGSLYNRGATLVGGHWFRHSNIVDLWEHPMQYQSGRIQVWGSVFNTTELAEGGSTYGGLIAGFDEFNIHGSLFNDANSMITGSYTHMGTGPGGIDDSKPYNTIHGRRANIRGGVMLTGEYEDAASVLNVMGIFSAEHTPGQPTFHGLYNEGHISEIDIISVGSNESGILMNIGGPTSELATLPSSSIPNPTGGSESIRIREKTEIFDESIPIETSGMITDIGVLNVTNLYNSGIISDIDVAINVSYSLVNDLTGEIDGFSSEHIEWTYNADGTPNVRQIVLQDTYANLHVGKATDANMFVEEGVSIENYGKIMNFTTISTLGDFYNAGVLENIEGITVSESLYLDTGTELIDVGALTAHFDVEITGDIDGGFSLLTARKGFLRVGSASAFPGIPDFPDFPDFPFFPGIPGFGSASLTIDRGAVASGHVVENFGTITVNGLLSSETTIMNEGFVINNGTISSFGDFINNGTISGKGMVFVANTSSSFRNESEGIISGGLAVNGNFRNERGTISLRSPSDVIRVTNGIAAIAGGEVNTTAYTNMEVGKQYLFLATDGPGDLHIETEFYGDGSGTPGSVLDLMPVYGSWDGTRYIAGKHWSPDNQFYWLEVQRAYSYEPYAKTYNQVAVAKYIDTISTTVKTNSALWNMLAQLDGVSENDPGYTDHRGQISPKALKALNELSGVSYANIGTASLHNIGVVNRTIADVLRSDVFKFSMYGNPNNAIRGQAIAPLRYTRWGTLFGIGGNTASDGNASGYKQSFGGVVAGVDRALWTGTRVGAWLSAATGDVTQRRVRENTDLTNVMVGMYLRQEMYFGYGLLSGGFGSDNYKTKRYLDTVGHRASSKYNGTVGTLYFERGIDIPVYYATVQPYASFHAASVWHDKFSETMWDQTGQYAGVGLLGQKGTTESFRGAVGVRASSMPVGFKWGQVALTANTAWFHEFNDKYSTFTARFANPGGNNYYAQNTAFTIRGTDPKRDWFNFGFALNMDRNSTRIFLGADLYENGRQTLFSGSGGFATSW